MKFINLLPLILLYCTIYIDCLPKKSKKAIVIVPVTDLVGQEIKKLVGPTLVQQKYDQLPISEKDPIAKTCCLRLHQLLFNEVVEILEEKEQEIRIRVPNLFYLIPASNKPQATYWMLKQHVITLDKMQKKTGGIEKIPLPLSFASNTTTRETQKIVTLIEPWFDKKTKKIFSAGTRFTYDIKKNNKVAVHLFNPHTMQWYVAEIPNNKCTISHLLVTPEQQRNNFVTILRQWAQKKGTNAIPYVWGGCSFINSKKNLSKPKTGFDCAGIITRAAQICNIPYFYKNTTTIAQCLKPIGKKTTLIPGDIIWIPGHVMIVSDLANHTLIEARGYDHGYGKIHEIPLHKEFKEIKTYHDLIKACHEKKPIIRLNGKGEKTETIFNLKLLQLTGSMSS